LLARLASDKKTIQGQGAFRAAAAHRRSAGGLGDRRMALVLAAIQAALA
jgi:hypothetical protein